MILNKSIIADLKDKANISFEQTKDVELLASLIFKETGRNRPIAQNGCFF